MTPEEQINGLITSTAHLESMLRVKPNQQDFQETDELQDICSLWLNPVTEEERTKYRHECLGDELDFERYIVGIRRIEYIRTLAEGLDG